MHTDAIDGLVCPRSRSSLHLDAYEADGSTVAYGTLVSDAGTYPIVCGIPIFLDGQERVLELLRAGRMREATAMATLANLPRSRRARVAAGLADGIGGPVRRSLCRLEDHRLQGAVGRIFGPDGAVSPEEVIRLVYLDSAARSVDAYNYFTHRYSSPRHLVALSCIEAAPAPRRPVLDFGCGAGHMTWPLQQRLAGQPVIGVDKSFFLLLLASHAVAPGQNFVCADGITLPFRSESFSLVFASDVLSFVTLKWPVVRELIRLLGRDGWLMLTSVKNSLREHVYAGEPLPPDGWRRLVEGLECRVLPDSSILRRYLAGDGLPESTGVAEATVRESALLSVLATKGPWSLDEGRRFAEWPHARGELAVNPLFRPAASEDPPTFHYERHFPSVTFADDNPEMRDYLPERFSIPAGVLRPSGEVTMVPEIEPLIASLCLLAFPPGFRDHQWVAAAATSDVDSRVRQ